MVRGFFVGDDKIAGTPSLRRPVKLVIFTVVIPLLLSLVKQLIFFNEVFFRLIQQKILTTLGNCSPQFLTLFRAVEHLGDAVDFFCHGILQRIGYGPIVRVFGLECQIAGFGSNVLKNLQR